MNPISAHITYKEAVNSPTAIRNGIDNTPTPEHLANMKAVAEKVFEPIRNHFGIPIKVESFYRCEALNKLVGGSVGSQHRFGQAIDIDDDLGGLTNADMFQWIVENIEWDQVIWEFGNDSQPDWVHVSYTKQRNRKRITRAIKGGKYIHYDTTTTDPIQHYLKACEFLKIQPV